MVDRSLPKIIILGALGVGFSALFGYFFVNLVTTSLPSITTLLPLLYTILAVSGFLILVTLQALLIKSVRIASLIALLETLALWLFVPEKFSLLALIGAALLLVFLISGFLNCRNYLNNSLKIKFFPVGRRVTPVAMTGLTLFLTLYLLSSFNLKEPAIPRTIFDFFIQGSEPIVAKFIPGFTLDGSIDDTLRAFVTSQLPAGTPTAAVAASVSELRQTVAQATGVRITGGEKVLDALYNISISQLLALPPLLKILALAVIGLAIFGLIKTLAFFLNWIIILVSFLIYRLLLALGFFYVAMENQSKEVIVVK